MRMLRAEMIWTARTEDLRRLMMIGRADRAVARAMPTLERTITTIDTRNAVPVNLARHGVVSEVGRAAADRLGRCTETDTKAVRTARTQISPVWR
jgi:hypothetical protein